MTLPKTPFGWSHVFAKSQPAPRLRRPRHAGTPLSARRQCLRFQKVLDRKNRAGLIVAADYEAFGKAWEYLPESTSPPSIEVNLRFPGQYLDRETGLHYNWHRYYDPNAGRYLTPDPMATSRPGWNQPTYSYGLNNPLLHIDRDGRQVIGNYCGFGNRGYNRDPTSDLDNACWAHDLDYERCDKKHCDYRWKTMQAKEACKDEADRRFCQLVKQIRQEEIQGGAGPAAVDAVCAVFWRETAKKRPPAYTIINP